MTKVDLLEKYNKSIPRYTSYPPANFFGDLNGKDYLEAIENSNINGEKNISIYIHIPFCHDLCYYCGCNMTILTKNINIDLYFKALKKEIQTVFKKINKNRKISQIHYGGGTPNSVDIKYIKEINKTIFNNFKLIEKPEIAIETHPAYIDEDYIDGLKEAGFTRISIGIQDTNIEVLKNVNRLGSKIDLKELFKLIRKKTVFNINLDLIYGLPGQTKESFEKTIDKCIELKPDRIVTFSYAHVPSIKPHQIALEKKILPKANEKKVMFENSKNKLIKNKYIQLGMDHFVLKSDELAKSFLKQKLARNFQGYCSKYTTSQVYAFGVSAISQLESGYFQNTKNIQEYITSIGKGSLTTKKGLIFKEKHKIIKDIIEEIMCNYFVDLKKISKRKNIEIKDLLNILQINKDDLNEMINDDLITFEENELRVKEKGKIFVRNIASLFDPEIKNSNKIFSKSI